MTRRQRKLGVAKNGYKRGIIEGEFLSSPEAFLAKAAMIPKGQYKGIDITRKWFGSGSDAKHEYQVKPFLLGLTALIPEYIHYSDTHGLDCLTIR